MMIAGVNLLTTFLLLTADFMKTLFILLLISGGFNAVAQRPSISKHINNDGRQLRIRVDIEDTNRSVHYSRSFDVADMEVKAIKELENHIIDSLEQDTPERISAVFADQKRDAKTKHRQRDESVRVLSATDEPMPDHLEANRTSTLSPGDVAPTSVLVREDKENGRLWMQYTFQKDGDELIIERTANVIGKSEREKQAVIRETERSFGIKLGNQ